MSGEDAAHKAERKSRYVVLVKKTAKAKTVQEENDLTDAILAIKFAESRSLALQNAEPSLRKLFQLKRHNSMAELIPMETGAQSNPRKRAPLPEQICAKKKRAADSTGHTLATTSSSCSLELIAANTEARYTEAESRRLELSMHNLSDNHVESETNRMVLLEEVATSEAESLASAGPEPVSEAQRSFAIAIKEEAGIAGPSNGPRASSGNPRAGIADDKDAACVDNNGGSDGPRIPRKEDVSAVKRTTNSALNLAKGLNATNAQVFFEYRQPLMEFGVTAPPIDAYPSMAKLAKMLDVKKGGLQIVAKSIDLKVQISVLLTEMADKDSTIAGVLKKLDFTRENCRFYERANFLNKTLFSGKLTESRTELERQVPKNGCKFAVVHGPLGLDFGVAEANTFSYHIAMDVLGAAIIKTKDYSGMVRSRFVFRRSNEAKLHLLFCILFAFGSYCPEYSRGKTFQNLFAMTKDQKKKARNSQVRFEYGEKLVAVKGPNTSDDTQPLFYFLRDKNNKIWAMIQTNVSGKKQLKHFLFAK
jgi:hypothetical protein